MALRDAIARFGARYAETLLSQHPPQRNSASFDRRWRHTSNDSSEMSHGHFEVAREFAWIEDIFEWEEFRAAIDAISRDSRVAPFLGNHDATHFMMNAVMRPMEHLIEEHRREFNLDLAVDLIDAWIDADVEPMLVAVPLVGFRASDDVSLDGELSLRRANDAEVSCLLSYGCIDVSGPFALHNGWATVDEEARWIVTVPRREPRQFDLTIGRSFDDAISTAEDAAADVVTASRLLTGQGKALRGPAIATLLRPTTPGAGSRSNTRRDAMFAWADPMTLDSQATSALPAMFSRVRGAGKLSAPLRRFGLIAERATAEDKVVDLMTALEGALVEDRTSLAYQVRRRGSALARHRFDPAAVSELLKCAYNARSAIVHGGRQPKWRSLDGTPCDADEHIAILTRVVSEILRIALLNNEQQSAWSMADQMIDEALRAL